MSLFHLFLLHRVPLESLASAVLPVRRETAESAAILGPQVQRASRARRGSLVWTEYLVFLVLQGPLVHLESPKITR